MERAIKEVEAGHGERICAPGLWVVWRDGQKIFSKNLYGQNEGG